MIKLTTPEGHAVWVNLATLAHMSAQRRLGYNEKLTTLTWPTQYTLQVQEAPEEIDGVSELGI